MFGETEVAGVGEVLTNWDAIKAEERKATGRLRRVRWTACPHICLR